MDQQEGRKQVSTDVSRWADQAMFEGEPHEFDPQMGVLPKVHLLWMTPDPLGAVAAMAHMYEGKVVRDLGDLTDDDRRKAWADATSTHLAAPLEAIKFHFMIDGVDRAFTHQMVRQRTAVYAQESQRFCVINELPGAVTLPPSLHGTDPWDDRIDYSRSSTTQQWRVMWDREMERIATTYQMLVDAGMPQEDARGLLPHATATRLNYITDLRNLVEHAGNRLCTQAQFHWRLVFASMTRAIQQYQPSIRDVRSDGEYDYIHDDTDWQFDTIATSGIFKPVCYRLNKCPFKASFDRPCAIRDRVDAFSKKGVPSREWGRDHNDTRFIQGDDYGYQSTETIRAIKTEEWLANPAAARVRA